VDSAPVFTQIKEIFVSKQIHSEAPNRQLKRFLRASQSKAEKIAISGSTQPVLLYFGSNLLHAH
jgi:hypothetical protein